MGLFIVAIVCFGSYALITGIINDENGWEWDIQTSLSMLITPLGIACESHVLAFFGFFVWVFISMILKNLEEKSGYQ